jgi:cobalt-zinc-cadmium efflux system protein
MSAECVALSARVTLDDGSAWPQILASAQRLLDADFGIEHVTLQPSWPLRPPTGRVIPLAAVARDESGHAPHQH